MTLRHPLTKHSVVIFVSAYASTLCSSDDVKDRFYDTLYFTLLVISHDDKIILLGDFNTRVGRSHDIWPGVICHHCVGNMKSSCLWLLYRILFGLCHHILNLPPSRHTENVLDWCKIKTLTLHRLRHCQAPSLA